MLGRLRNFKVALAHVRNGRKVSLAATEISSDSSFAPGARVAHHASIRSSSVGRNSSIGRYAKIAYAELGAYCSVSWDTTIGAIAHPVNRATTHAFPYASYLGFFEGDDQRVLEQTRIGSDVWIGAGAIVLPGVSIAHGAVIAAGSVVTHDVGPYEIVAGVPARVLRTRFDQDLLERMLAVEWWDWPDDVVKSSVELFREPLDQRVISELERIGSRMSREFLDGGSQG